MNLPERAIVNTVAAAYYKADHYFLRSASSDANRIQQKYAKHIPLVPLARLFTAIANLNRDATE